MARTNISQDDGRCQACGGWPEHKRTGLFKPPGCTCEDGPTLISQFDVTDGISRTTGIGPGAQFGCLVVLAILALAAALAQAGAL